MSAGEEIKAVRREGKGNGVGKGDTMRTDAYRDMTAVAFVESMILVQYTFYLYGHFFR